MKKILTESNVRGEYNLWDGFVFNFIITSSLCVGLIIAVLTDEETEVQKG